MAAHLRNNTRDCAAAWLAAALVCVPARAGAQNSPAGVHSVDFWIGASTAVDRCEATVTSAYSPPLLRDGAFTSRGGQTLQATANRAPGLAGGIGFSTSRFGVQIMFEWSRRGVAGRNGPYAFELAYTSREPPDDRPQSVDVRRSVAWPDTSGSIDETSIALDLTSRFGDAAHPHVVIFGGPTILRIRGRLEPLAFTAFRLGGRSVLFEDDYRLALDVSPAHAIGVEVGGTLNLPVARRAAVSVGIRYVVVGRVDPVATPSAVLNPAEIGAAEPLDVVTGAIGTIPVRLNVSSLRVISGITVRR